MPSAKDFAALHGATAKQHHVVGEDDTAMAVGSGSLAVLGTPVVVAWMEAATCAAIELDPGLTTVGTRVEVDHLRASAVGESIAITAEVTQVAGNRLTFSVSATNAQGTEVARARIERAVVDSAAFMARLQEQ